MPELKDIVRRRHPSSRIAYGEFIRGLDGKMRYFRDIRAEFYSFMVDKIRQADPGLCAYLCMEDDGIWKESFGFSPEETRWAEPNARPCGGKNDEHRIHLNTAKSVSASYLSAIASSLILQVIAAT